MKTTDILLLFILAFVIYGALEPQEGERILFLLINTIKHQLQFKIWGLQ